MVGASLEEVEEEEEAEEEGPVSAPKEGCFKVIGTVKDKSSPKPSFVKEILNVRMLVYFVQTQWITLFSDCQSQMWTMYCSIFSL